MTAGGTECTYPGRPVGPPDHSPGRNPGAYRIRPPQPGLQPGRVPGDVYSPRAGAPGGAYAIRPYTGTRTNISTGHRPQQFNGASADAGEAGQVPGKLGWRP